MQIDKPIIVALDVPSQAQALTLARRLDPLYCRVKVGKELFVSSGPNVIAALRELGFEVFLDLKFHDIPQTVANACRAAAGLGVWMMNVHASGGSAMLQAARDALQAFNPRPLLTGVTVLTSLADSDLPVIGWPADAAAQVSRLARLCQSSGLDGVVCSAQEAALLRRELGTEFLLVTPGIRLAEDSRDDQSRVMTPQLALQQGASYLVIGRPIAQAADPRAKLQEIHYSITGGARR